MTRYTIELVNLKNEKRQLMKGAFSVNRSGNTFAGVPADMALEQSINVHAKNCLKGIIVYADINPTLNRLAAP